MDIVKDLLSDITSEAVNIAKESTKKLIGTIKEELTPAKGQTKGIGEECSKQTECSLSGKNGGVRAPIFGSTVGCCGGTCEFKRTDHLGILFCPDECRKEGIFGPPGTCPPSIQELNYMSQLKKDEEKQLIESIEERKEKEKEMTKEKLEELLKSKKSKKQLETILDKETIKELKKLLTKQK